MIISIWTFMQGHDERWLDHGHNYIYILYIIYYIYIYYNVPQKLTAVCFIQKESLGGRPEGGDISFIAMVRNSGHFEPAHVLNSARISINISFNIPTQSSVRDFAQISNNHVSQLDQGFLSLYSRNLHARKC